MGLIAALRPQLWWFARDSFSALSMPNTKWYGQWTPQFGNMAFYYGEVINVRSAGRLIPSKRLTTAARLRRDSLAGVPLLITATMTRITPRLATIFSI